MDIRIQEENGFKYIDEGEGEVLLLLHGLFGALSNWEQVVKTLSGHYRVIIPVMPIYEMEIRESSVDGLVDFIESFVQYKQLQDVTVIGNSLGGHVGLIYTLRHPGNVKRLVLTGSSGLFENGMGGSYPKRGSYEYIKERVEYTFYNPATATSQLIEEVFEIVSSIPKCMRIVAIAKSAQRHNMAEEILQIQVPTLLIWGLNDTITPAEVAYEFNKLIAGSRLYFIDKCCHAPMMEQPERFNVILTQWLKETELITA
jgi:pimeloyl-ACP methyl ester carboxylesterase